MGVQILYFNMLVAIIYILYHLYSSLNGIIAIFIAGCVMFTMKGINLVTLGIESSTDPELLSLFLDKDGFWILCLLVLIAIIYLRSPYGNIAGLMLAGVMLYSVLALFASMMPVELGERPAEPVSVCTAQPASTSHYSHNYACPSSDTVVTFVSLQN